MKKISGFVKGLGSNLHFTNRGAVIDKGSIYVVVILTLLIFGGYIFAGGTIPVTLPKMSTELVNVLSPIREDAKSSLQLQTFYGVTPTPYPTPPPVPTAGLADPKLIDCDRNITGQNTPQLIWATKSDATPASDNEEAIKVFYSGKDALLLGAGNVPSMVNSPSDRIANPSIGDQSARDPSGFVYYPALFITDITTNPGEARGDSQSGGQANRPDTIYGTWKSRGVSNPRANNQIITPSQDAFPPVNGPPGPRDTDYSSEIIWKTGNLSAFNPQGGGFVPLVKGNKYRIQVVLHSGGDPEELAVSCFEWTMPGGVSPTPTPTPATGGGGGGGGGTQACANLEAPPSMDPGFVLVENVCPGEPGWPTTQQIAGKDVKIIMPKNRECRPGTNTTALQGTESNPVKDIWIVGGVLRGSGYSFRNYSGTILIEGALIDQQGQCQDAINGFYGRGDGGRWVVQNTHITGVSYCDPGTHGDTAHPQGSGAMLNELKFQNVWAHVVRQGLFIVPRTSGPYPGHGVKKLTFDHVFLQADPKVRMAGKQVATMIYWAEQWGPPVNGVSFNNTYLKWWGGADGASKSMRRDITIPNVASFDGNECATYGANAKVTGKWCAGDPPNAFVPLDKIGLNYNRDTFCTPAAGGGGGNPAPTGGGDTGGNTGGDNVAQGPQCSGAAAPPLAKNAGLTKLAFCEDFSDPSRINLDGTLNTGQTFTQVTKGNIFGADKMPASAFTFSNGIMSVKPTRNNYQVNFISTVPTGGGNFKGYAMRGAGWYTEIRWKHTNCGQSSAFPAFWSMDAGHLYNTGKKPFLEPDFYENIGGRYIGALHNWAEGGRKNGSAFTIQAMPSTPTNFFTAGAISEPGATGYSWHFNDRLMKREAPSWVNMFNNFVGPVMFGSGPNCPYDVDYVRVWTR